MLRNGLSIRTNLWTFHTLSTVSLLLWSFPRCCSISVLLGERAVLSEYDMTVTLEFFTWNFAGKLPSRYARLTYRQMVREPCPE